MWSSFKKDIIDKKYRYAFISTTSKHSEDFLRLPDREILKNNSIHLLISNETIAKEILGILDGIVPELFIDVERKQEIDLIKIAKENVLYSEIHPYKPNDITIEAADQLLLQHFHGSLTGRKVLIYGTGNIGMKLAIRLAERNAKVFLAGRDKDKASKLAEAINLILPAFATGEAKVFDEQESYDAIISFVSAEKVVTGDLAELLQEGSIAIDGGIGNFSPEFISEAIHKGIDVLRLDVRIGLPFLEASTSAGKQSFFHHVMGQREINNVSIVAGGIIGAADSVIVDSIDQPVQIIGIANGIGGVKNESALTDGNKSAIEIVKEFIIQNR